MHSKNRKYFPDERRGGGEDRGGTGSAFDRRAISAPKGFRRESDFFSKKSRVVDPLASWKFRVSEVKGFSFRGCASKMRWTVFPSRSAGSRLYARSFTLFPNKSENVDG